MSAFMETYSGRRVSIPIPQPHEIAVEDIAHHLARQCRYAGAVRVPHYSVAQHAYLVASWCYDAEVRSGRSSYAAETAYAALHHDSAEAYLQDIPRPWKGFMLDYQMLEANVEWAVREALGLPEEMPDLVKEADFRILNDEREQLLLMTDNIWDCEDVSPLGVHIFPWSAEIAEVKFLDAHYRYLARMEESRRAA